MKKAVYIRFVYLNKDFSDRDLGNDVFMEDLYKPVFFMEDLYKMKGYGRWNLYKYYIKYDNINNNNNRRFI